METSHPASPTLRHRAALIASLRLTSSSEIVYYLFTPTLTSHVVSRPLLFLDKGSPRLLPPHFTAFVRTLCLRKRTLHLVGRSDTPFCEACEAIKSVFHILRSCSLYATYRDVLYTSIESAGRSRTALHHWLYPPEPPVSVFVNVFGALLQCLEQSGLATRFSTHCRC